ncbi:MAG: aspartate aminotransferase family protein, partial [Pseudomonadota bacterium]
MDFAELQALMQAQRADGTLARQAQQEAFRYLAGQSGQAAFPSTDAVSGLEAFDHPLPEGISDASVLVSQLAQFGAPATTAIGGGRYFGFVNGGLLPVAFAARWMADAWDQNAALGVMS